MSPNIDGGFAPNYTPLATVDVASGLIVACDVIAMTIHRAEWNETFRRASGMSRMVLRGVA